MVEAVTPARLVLPDVPTTLPSLPPLVVTREVDETETPLSTDADSAWAMYFNDTDLREEIRKVSVCVPLFVAWDLVGMARGSKGRRRIVS